MINAMILTHSTYHNPPCCPPFFKGGTPFAPSEFMGVGETVFPLHPLQSGRCARSQIGVVIGRTIESSLFNRESSMEINPLQQWWSVARQRGNAKSSSAQCRSGATCEGPKAPSDLLGCGGINIVHPKFRSVLQHYQQGA